MVEYSSAPGDPPQARTDHHPTLNFHTCNVSIDGQSLWLWTGIQTGYSHIAAVNGAWLQSNGRYLYVQGRAERRVDLERMLVAIRTVRNRRDSSATPANDVWY